MELWLGDCLDVMPLVIENESIDLIFSDLPYEKTQCEWDKLIDITALWKEYKRVLKPNGVVALTGVQPFSAHLVMSNLEWFKYEIIWEKGNATNFLNAKKQPLRAHENILIFYKGAATYNPQMVQGQLRRKTKRKTVNSEIYGKALSLTEYDSTERYPRSVQFFSSDKQKENLHPTQKPVALCEWVVNTFSNPGDTILDSTMGSGSTGVACKNTSRNFIGIELKESNFLVAQQRLEGK